MMNGYSLAKVQLKNLQVKYKFSYKLYINYSELYYSSDYFFCILTVIFQAII